MSPIYASFVTFLLVYVITVTHATTITILNNCDYTVWAAANPGGGKQLAKGNTWDVNPPPGTKTGRVWGRTGCNFDGNGNGNCQTGGCGKLVCNLGNTMGTTPRTLFEYALVQPNNPINDDIADISLIEGFNIPMSFSPSTGTGSLSSKCRTISCTDDINGQCPQKWKVPGGCNNPCTTQGIGTCGANGGSRFFKQRCPDAYSFPQDNGPTSTFGCPRGTNFSLTFCP